MTSGPAAGYGHRVPDQPTSPAPPPAETPAHEAGSVSVVVLGAGSGSRGGAGGNKGLLPLAGRPVLAWSVLAALRTPGVARVLVVAHPDELDEVAEALAPHLPADSAGGTGSTDGADDADGADGGKGPGTPEVGLVAGGLTRHASESRALRALAADVEAGRTEVVVVHDGARPLAPVALFTAVVEAARARGGALPGAPMTGVLTRALQPVPSALVGVQTPQAFRAGPLLAAYRRADDDGFEGTDTAACFARYADLPVVAVASGPANLKVTWPEDLALAEELLGLSGR